VGEVIDHICVMVSYEPSVVCYGRKCDGSGVMASNMVESEVIWYEATESKIQEEDIPKAAEKAEAEDSANADWHCSYNSIW